MNNYTFENALDVKVVDYMTLEYKSLVFDHWQDSNQFVAYHDDRLFPSEKYFCLY